MPKQKGQGAEPLGLTVSVMEAVLGLLEQFSKQEKSQFGAEIYAFGAEKLKVWSKETILWSSNFSLWCKEESPHAVNGKKEEKKWCIRLHFLKICILV